MGIIGLGNVGRQVARICSKGLDMRVLAYDPYLTAAEFQERGATQVDLDTLLAQSDFVTVHCPYNAETRGMIGQRELALMPRDAFLITTARGGIVEEGALAAALETKQIAGAGVDVWNVEPPPLEHPLLTFDNVIATYHTAGVTVDSRHLMAQWNAEQLVHIFQGKRPPRLVNPEAWEGFAQRLRRRSDSDRPLNCVPVQGSMLHDTVQEILTALRDLEQQETLLLEANFVARVYALDVLSFGCSSTLRTCSMSMGIMHTWRACTTVPNGSGSV